MILAGIVTGDIHINLVAHGDVEALIKTVYKSETENHPSCDWTKGYLFRSQYMPLNLDCDLFWKRLKMFMKEF